MKVSPVNLSNSNVSMQHRRTFTAPPSKARIFYNDHKATTYSSGILAAGVGTIYLLNSRHISTLAKSIARSMSKISADTVDPKRLASIMSGDELLAKLPHLSKINYKASPDNIQKGILKADLHSHSNYSDGEGLVKNLLDDATDYADVLFTKTKQKFIYALSDHDTVEGLKEAMTIMAGNPQRYQNLNFVPAIEVSFAHKASKTGNPCEIAELLVYGINPYSAKVNQFLDNIRKKRTDMIQNFIKDASKECPLTKFSFEEFSKYYEFEKYGNLMNIHWRVYHYTQTKHAITQYASKINKDPELLYNKIMENSKGASIGKLHDEGKLPADIQESQNFKDIMHKYEPHVENGKIIASSENTFEEVINAFKDEKGIFMAFAHPYYYAERVDNPVEGLKYFMEHSHGLIKGSESYHQAYQSRIKPDDIEHLQKETEKLGLLNLGGQDNHKRKLF